MRFETFFFQQIFKFFRIGKIEISSQNDFFIALDSLFQERLKLFQELCEGDWSPIQIDE